jgi:hypothetical protein
MQIHIEINGSVDAESAPALASLLTALSASTKRAEFEMFKQAQGVWPTHVSAEAGPLNAEQIQEAVDAGMAAAESAKPARTTKSKPAAANDEGKAAPTPEPTEVAGSEPAATSASPSDNPAVTYAAVQAAVRQASVAQGRDFVIATLASFGVDHASKLTEVQWGDAIAALTQEQAA